MRSGVSKSWATDFLIIGYGNTLRSDDGIGPRVAEAIAAWRLPNVRAIALHQLTPELAESLAGAEVAIFVDARAGDPAVPGHAGVTFESIAAADAAADADPAEAIAPSEHTSDPRRLLALTKRIYGRCPQAWLVSIPGVNFELGETLSEQARRGVDIALRRIRLLFTSQ